MTLKNALDHFNRLVSESSKKSEIKVYQEFINLVAGLEEKNFTQTEIQSIETKLNALDFNPTTTNKKKYFSKALKQFKKYLKDTFSLVTKGYYTELGLALGSSFGVIIGTVFLSSLERSLGISLGVSIGTLIGLLIGSNLDFQAKASGKMV